MAFPATVSRLPMGSSIRVSPPPARVNSQSIPIMAGSGERAEPGAAIRTKTNINWHTPWGIIDLIDEERTQAACELIAFFGEDASDIKIEEVEDYDSHKLDATLVSNEIYKIDEGRATVLGVGRRPLTPAPSRVSPSPMPTEPQAMSGTIFCK